MTAIMNEVRRVTADDLLDFHCRDLNGELFLPVDPFVIARAMGASVYRVSLPVGVSGALVQKDSRSPMILLNEQDAAVRQRFTCAHEVGHLAARISNGTDQVEYADVDYREQGHGSRNETFANEFAADLLMPEVAVRRLAKASNSSVVQLASEFAVSVQAMNIRLGVLGVTTAR